MKIIEYVSEVADLLSLWDATKVDLNIIENNDATTVSRINKICNLVNDVVYEIAMNFVPMITQTQVKTSDGVVPFSQLRPNIISIEKILDENGKEINFTIYPEKLKMDKTSGTIYYRRLPNYYKKGNEIDFTEYEVPKKVILYGTAAEFCLTEGLFEEAMVWHEKYREQIKMLTKPKNYKLAKREWA